MKIPHIFHRWEYLPQEEHVNTVLDKKTKLKRPKFRRCKVCNKTQVTPISMCNGGWHTIEF